MWYFKGRRKKYKSPYTGKEVDAAVKNSQAFPEYAAADSGKFLRVNADGKLDFNEYPIETEIEVIFEGNVTTAESPETVNVVEYDGTAEDFSKLTVKVNGETLTYDSTYQSFDDAGETVSILLQTGYIKLFAYNANTFAVDIKDISSSIDEGFSGGVDAVTGLPKPTLADEGKVVGVDENGEYALVDGGGGGEFLVTVSGSFASLHADKQFTEILSAINSGTIPVLKVSSIAQLANCLFIYEGSSDSAIMFTKYTPITSLTATSKSFASIVIKSNESVTLFDGTMNITIST